MQSSSQSEKELTSATLTSNATLVREQLNRLLAHPLFTNSKRYPVLLAYTVEQALLGNAGELKERTIGVEAFGREPSYDVNLDPVVRTTAAEVRKRLIQYYYNTDHFGELIVELSVGSYVPSFRVQTVSVNLDSGSLVSQGSAATSQDSPTTEFKSAGAAPPPIVLTKHRWIPIATLSLLALIAGFGMGRIQIP